MVPSIAWLQSLNSINTFFIVVANGSIQFSALDKYVIFAYNRSVKIILSKTAKKQLDTIPDHIYRKYLYWIDLLKTIGLLQARRYQGFHDEPLKGERKGQRSVRLSKAYRAIYQEVHPGNYEIIEIIEVNKHDY